jgi:predicted site-specific integrase-resolvase
MDESEVLVTVTVAAKLLGVSCDTLRNWDNSGKLKAVPREKSGYRQYRLSDLREHLGPSKDELATLRADVDTLKKQLASLVALLFEAKGEK